MFHKAPYYAIYIIAQQITPAILNHDGGPFGAVIVKNGEVIASGHNRVFSSNDSTCHGEIDAIRKAESKLRTYDLSDCELYTTGEPCPMCLAAILWANIKKYITDVDQAIMKKLDFEMQSLMK